MRALALLLLLAGGADLADIDRVNPRIRLDIRYATANNFTHHKVYDEARCFLQAGGGAQRLSQVQQDLERAGSRAEGLRLLPPALGAEEVLGAGAGRALRGRPRQGLAP